tara:strand:+ start:582 stop:806 length:225 start_codon:yes stop_codon:yes gene_type:complete
MVKSQAEKTVDYVIAQLKEIRLEQGLSHEKLAEKAGLHRTAISLIESRKRQPSFINCIKIADALGVNLADLLKT